MKRRDLLNIGLLTLGLVCLAPSASWSQAPLKREEQLANAKWIVRAKVVDVKTVKEDAQPSGYDLVTTARIKVQGSEKGKLKNGQVLDITYRKVAKRPETWVGPRGQRQPLKAGTSVRLFLEGQEGNYTLLNPNGWEPLAQW
jgi:hypothetical protein